MGNYANLKKKDLLCIVADRMRTACQQTIHRKKKKIKRRPPQTPPDSYI